jgi:hypothetical protein
MGSSRARELGADGAGCSGSQRACRVVSCQQTRLRVYADHAFSPSHVARQIRQGGRRLTHALTVRQFFGSLHEQQLKPATIHKAYQVIRTFLRWALALQVIAGNPAPKRRQDSGSCSSEKPAYYSGLRTFPTPEDRARQIIRTPVATLDRSSAGVSGLTFIKLDLEGGPRTVRRRTDYQLTAPHHRLRELAWLWRTVSI